MAVSAVNAGLIEGRINLAVGGFVTNQAGGTITDNGPGAVIGSSFQPITAVNAGVITGGTSAGGGGTYATGEIFGRSFGFSAVRGGSFTNEAGGTISAFVGVAAYNSTVTVVNAGTIIGTGEAVYFQSGFNSRLIVDPGAVFSGGIAGGGGVVELASGSSQGTLSGFGSSITNFATVQFDAGSHWTVAGNDSASGLGAATITGFAVGDTIDLTDFAAVGYSFASNKLVVTNDSAGHVTLTVEGSFDTFRLSGDGATGTDITLCFLAGTQIRTPHGDVAVENLSAGDLVLNHQGEAQTITWIGAGCVLATKGRRNAATPVIVRRGAFGDGVPYRDLRVTKGHSFYFDGVLVPVEFLVNHRSIMWDDHAQEVRLYHIELARHDVLIANGAPAESYRDDGNRWLFQNANTGWGLPAQEPYAPIMTGGPEVDTLWRRFLDRAGARPDVPLTDDPDVHLLVDGRRLDPLSRHGSAYVFRLAGRPVDLRVASRASVPQELRLARDARALGVAIRQIVAADRWRTTRLDAADAALCDGFHDYEPEDQVRWTNGDAALPAALFARIEGPCLLTLHLGCVTQYADDGMAVAA